MAEEAFSAKIPLDTGNVKIAFSIPTCFIADQKDSLLTLKKTKQ
jgi:hypothetical protein